LCGGCSAVVPLRFRLAPGRRKTLSLRLSKLGRSLLANHPGLAIEIVGKLTDKRPVVEHERLREPATLTDVCRFPAAVGGDASVSGTLTPAHAGDAITVEYVPSGGAGVLLPAVQRKVFTDRAGRFSGRYALGTAGRWVIVVNWGGDTTRQPTSAPTCAEKVQKAQTHVTLTCPTAAAIAGTPSQFSGTLSGGPADTGLAVVYVAPSGAVLANDVMTGSGGGFATSFAPDAAGGWQAEANYNGDANHGPASAVCQFTVVVAPTSLSMQCTPDPNAHYISCTGQLTSDGVGVGGAQLALTYTPPSPGSPVMDTATTAAGGTFSDTCSVPASGPPLPSGMWSVEAQYAGDSAHGPASNTQSVTVP
jgi:hypothetical protein